MGSEKKHSSVKKYWIILALWFFLPMFIKNILKIQMPSSTLMFGFVPPYWLFVMATFAYERYVIMSYLKKKYPLEVKERKGKAVFSEGKKLDFNFLMSFSPPNDSEWKAIQSNFKEYMNFVSVSFIAVICFGFIYGLLNGR